MAPTKFRLVMEAEGRKGNVGGGPGWGHPASYPEGELVCCPLIATRARGSLRTRSAFGTGSATSPLAPPLFEELSP